jgi:magnesium-transporting ATPase (P-type)
MGHPVPIIKTKSEKTFHLQYENQCCPCLANLSAAFSTFVHVHFGVDITVNLSPWILTWITTFFKMLPIFVIKVSPTIEASHPQSWNK